MSKFQVKITEKGVFIPSNVEGEDDQEIPVGTVLTLDSEPVRWENKYILISGDEVADKELKTGSKKKTKAKEAPVDEELQDIIAQCEALGVESKETWGKPAYRKALAAALEAQNNDGAESESEKTGFDEF